MNKKEVSEIKKIFTVENSVITTICSCYVDAEKNKKSVTHDAFYSLPDEVCYKYMDILKKSLSGRLERNLLNMDFSDVKESYAAQQLLQDLRDCELKNDDLLDQFFDSVIDNYDITGNYLIILTYGSYDIPGKSSDGNTMYDASDEVYRHILCCICPVNLSKAGLSFDSNSNRFAERKREWIVEMPATAFLFPAFNNRSADINSILYYSSKAEKLNLEFVEQVLGCVQPISAGVQKERFQNIIQETLGNDCEFDTVKEIHEQLSSMIENNKDSDETLTLGKNEIVRLLSASGVENERLQELAVCFDENAGNEQPLFASNVADSKFEVKTPDVIVHVKSDRTDLVETRVCDGRPCLMITLSDSVEVNGIPVSMPRNSPDA